MPDLIFYRVIKIVVTLLSLLPMRLLRFFSDTVGLIWFKIDKRHRRVVINNIIQAYPGRFSEASAQKFTKENFKHTAGLLFEVIWTVSKKRENLFAHFSVNGVENILNARKKKKGVIMLSCHMGNFELLSVAVARAGIYPWGLYRKFDFLPLERYMLEIRERFGAKMIPLRKASAKVNDLLAQGEIVATLLDQNVDWYKGVFVDYFGRPACTNNGLAKLALRTGACVVPAYIRREGRQFILEFLPEIPLSVTHDPIKDVETNTQKFVSAIESMVRQCPKQYFWVHNRWKTKPYCLLGER